MKKLWTESEITWLIENYPNKQIKELMAESGLTASRINNKAYHLGLQKTAEHMKANAQLASTYHTHATQASQFKSGQIPWNKGKRFDAGGKSAETRFKKGMQPLNTQPIGSLRFDKNGILQRKISNKSGNNSLRWRSVHELVWIEANGPLPPKHIVVFKPGMKTNVLEEITLEKLECISFSENMKRNSMHRYPKEITQLIQLKGAINRQLNKKERANEQSTNA